MDKAPKRYLTGPQVQRRYNRTKMTIWRWENDPELGFPKPFIIKGKKYHDEDKLDAFDAAQVREGAA